MARRLTAGRVLLTTFVLLALLAPEAPAWSMKQAGIMTPWAEEIDPAAPLPEYPRPQMVRDEWLNLNGVWQWRSGAAGEPAPIGQELAGEILVPFCVESAISGVKEHHERLWYRRTFEVPAEWAGKRVMLHFDAVDWECEVYLNGQSLGVHKGGYDQFSFDITDALVGPGPQELIVRVFDPTSDQSIAVGKQHLVVHSIWFEPVTGIWQTVWLEPVAPAHIESLYMVPNVDASRLEIRPNIVNAAGLTLNAIARRTDGTIAGTGSAAAGSQVNVPVAGGRLWTPDDPYLYDLTLQLKQGSTVIDEVESYFGMRKVEVEKVEGITRITLNDEYTFHIGPLDQGWWPDGLYTPPTDEALRFDVQLTRDCGFNMSRKHVKVEPARWYYWCDKLGLLVYQDMPNMPAGSSSNSAQRAQFETELHEMVREKWNHPSIIMWIIFNENWGQYDPVRITNEVMALDPSRLVSDSSGWAWTDAGAGHIVDWHNYPTPAAPPPSDTRASVAGEYGGISRVIPGHIWDPAQSGGLSEEGLLRRYNTYLQQLMLYQDDPGVSAAVYTEATDVYRELCGMITFDRKVYKTDPARFYELNVSTRRDWTPVVPTSESSPQTWRYTIEAPPTDWMAADFDDSTWSAGPGGFGIPSTPGAVIGTTWNSLDIWIRREFTLGELDRDELSRLWLRMHHDDKAEIYINGFEAQTTELWTWGYAHFPIGEVAELSLRPGRNVIAIHCHQDGGNQYIDVGIDMMSAEPGRLCGDGGFPVGDVDRDCRADLRDFARLLADWLACTTVNTPGCTDPR